MNVVIFGATGMSGAGVLLECFADPRVTSILVVTRSPTGRTQTAYDIARPLYPLIHRLLPNNATTTSNLGRAMIQVAATGYSKHVLYSADFNTLAEKGPA